VYAFVYAFLIYKGRYLTTATAVGEIKDSQMARRTNGNGHTYKVGNSYNLVVIADISFDQRDIDVVLGAQVRDAVFKTLIERVIDDDRFAGSDEFICDMCTDVASTTCK